MSPATFHDAEYALRIGVGLVRQIAHETQLATGQLLANLVGEDFLPFPPPTANVNLLETALLVLPIIERMESTEDFGRGAQVKYGTVWGSQIVPVADAQAFPLRSDVAVVQPQEQNLKARVLLFLGQCLLDFFPHELGGERSAREQENHALALFDRLRKTMVDPVTRGKVKLVKPSLYSRGLTEPSFQLPSEPRILTAVTDEVMVAATQELSQ